MIARFGCLVLWLLFDATAGTEKPNAFNELALKFLPSDENGKLTLLEKVSVVKPPHCLTVVKLNQTREHWLEYGDRSDRYYITVSVRFALVSIKSLAIMQRPLGAVHAQRIEGLEWIMAQERNYDFK